MSAATDRAGQADAGEESIQLHCSQQCYLLPYGSLQCSLSSSSGSRPAARGCMCSSCAGHVSQKLAGTMLRLQPGYWQYQLQQAILHRHSYSLLAYSRAGKDRGCAQYHHSVALAGAAHLVHPRSHCSWLLYPAWQLEAPAFHGKWVLQAGQLARQAASQPSKQAASQEAHQLAVDSQSTPAGSIAWAAVAVVVSHAASPQPSSYLQPCSELLV